MHISNVLSYKRIAHTNYIVDCFNLDIEGCTHYFLSHFHSDHYYGISKSFKFPIYCSYTTSSLLTYKYKVKTIPLKMNTVYELDKSNTVMCIDANHCPGAVCFIFKIRDDYILHTGDFRSTIKFVNTISRFKFKYVYLDNTYENYRSFPSQAKSIHRIIDIMKSYLNRPSLIPVNYKFMFCTYCIGKEKVFLSIAQYFDMSIFIDKNKSKIYECYDQYSLDILNKEVMDIVNFYKDNLTYNSKKTCAINLRRIKYVKTGLGKYIEIKDCNEKALNSTLVDHENKNYKSSNVLEKSTFPFGDKTNQQTKDNNKHVIGKFGQDFYMANKKVSLPTDRMTSEEKENQINVISTRHIEKTKINEKCKDIKADRIVVFCGTGWKDKIVSFDWIKRDGRIVKKGIEIIFIPYSEHSSSDELEYFKKNVDYEKLINTVKKKNLY